MIAIDLSKQKKLATDPKTIAQSNFTGNLSRERNVNIIIYFVIEEVKEAALGFSQRTVKVSWMSLHDLATACSTVLFCFIIILI